MYLKGIERKVFRYNAKFIDKQKGVPFAVLIDLIKQLTGKIKLFYSSSKNRNLLLGSFN